MKKIINKWKKLPQTVKASTAFIISSFILKGIAFITTPIFTRIMDSTQYGIIATYNSWVSIIEIFALLGLTSAGVFNVGLNENKETRSKYISSCLGLCNISTLVVFLIILILKVFLGNQFLISNELLVIMFIHFLFNPAQIFWITRQRYEYKYKLATTITIISIIISQILSIVTILLIKQNEGFIKILTNELGTLLFAIPIYILLLKKGKDYINLKQWKKILIFAIPLIPHYLAQHVMAGADRIMIAEMVSQSDAGIYNVVANIGLVASIIWTSINGSLIPYTYESISNKRIKGIKNITNILLISYFIACVFVILIAPEFINILAPSEYYFGIYAIPPLIIVCFSQALYNLYANIEFYYKKSFWITIATITATIINIILNFIFIPKYSFIAASYTTLISYLILILMHYIGYRKCQNEKLYDDKIIIILLVSLIIIGLLSNILYRYDILRYIFITLIFVIAIIKRKKLINGIKKLKRKD